MRTYKIVPFVLALLVIFMSAGASTQAQEGKGGIIIEGAYGKGPDTFNPILCLRQDCLDILRFLMPGFVGADPKTLLYEKKGPGAVVTDWKVSDDGLTYTFTLRKDLNWSDGTPVTSQDYLYSWNALKDETVESPFIFLTADIADVKAPDPQTVVVTMKSATCNALGTAASIPLAPAHVLGDPKKLKDSPFNTNPNVSAGVFKFGEFRTADQVSLLADQSYPDKLEAAVKPEGYIYKIVPDQTVWVEQFLAGATNVIDTPVVSRRADIRKLADTGAVKVFSYPGDSWDYISLNMGDPKNPQPGLDKDGKPIDQGHHPIFGDKRVRQAIATALDVDSIIKGAVYGEATRMASSFLPSSWAFNKDLKPIPYDVEAAKKLLDDAGWKDVGSDGIRIAKGAKYAPDGTRLSFKLVTIQGNPRRTAIANIVKDQLKQVGIDVDFQPMEFGAMSDLQNSQTGDAFIGAWGGGDPNDPDQTQFWSSESDAPNSGSNFVSYNNPELNDLMNKAKNPPCDMEQRKKLYYRIQEILRDDVPYVWLHVLNGMYAVRSTVNGFNPYPRQLYWNVDVWSVSAK